MQFDPKNCIYWEKWKQLMPDEVDRTSGKKEKILYSLKYLLTVKGSLRDVDVEDIENVCCSIKSARLQPF